MTPDRHLPVVSIVGRPNVGKSSLFNRIIGRRHAVVEKREGTTRDRIEKPVSVKDKSFMLVDTGGFVLRGTDEMGAIVKAQIEKAVASSDALLFVCDGKRGLSPLDGELAAIMRKSGKRIILTVNKMDNEKIKAENLADFYELGLGEPFGISCLHNLGVRKLLCEITGLIPEYRTEGPDKARPIKVAIVGRPNVGKSSFLNKVLGEERVIVHERPGTTRDSLDTHFNKDGISYLLIDTAGIRHKRKVKMAVDVYSVMRAKESIDRSDVCILLIDGMEGVANDDARVFDYITEKGKGCAILVNKWDLVKEIEMSKYKNAVLRKMPSARNYPIAFMSAKTGRNVQDALNLVNSIKTNSDLLIGAAALKEFLKEIAPESVKAPRSNRRPRFYYMTEVNVFPKEFIVFVNDTRAVTAHHTSFIENRLRERFPLLGVPIRIGYRRIKCRLNPKYETRNPKQIPNPKF